MLKISPVGNRVLIRLKKIKEKTESGIMIPDTITAEEKQTNGEVVAVGDLVECVRVEDRVIYSQAIVEVGDKDDKLIIVEEQDILAIIEKEE